LLAGARFLAAGTILLLIMPRASSARSSASDWVQALFGGALMLTLGGGLVHWSEQLVPSNLAALVICATPLFMVLLDWVRPGGARPRGMVLAGVTLGLGGMALLVGASTSGPDRIAPLGIAALCTSALAWSVGSLYTRYARATGTSFQISGRQLISGGALLLALSALSGELSGFKLGRISFRSLLAFMYLVVFGSVVAFSAYGWLLRVSTPARVATTAYVTPIVAMVLGWLVLDETLSTSQAAGALVVLASVFLMTRRNRAAG
jgi:drug/metabolite transporter (DMT)-like permease